MIGINLGLYASQLSTNSPFSFGNSLRTLPSNDFVSFASGLGPIDGASKLSIHYWVKVDSSDIAVVGGGASGGSRIHLLKFSNNNLIAVVANGAGTLGFCSFNGFENTKALVSLVFDGTLTGNENRCKLYINAIQQTLSFQGTIRPTIPNESSDFRINSYEITGEFGQADYNEIVITTDASTPSQISSFYNSGNGNFANDSFTNILAYWQCNELDGSTLLTDSVGTVIGQLNNFVTPPAYFVPF